LKTTAADSFSPPGKTGQIAWILSFCGNDSEVKNPYLLSFRNNSQQVMIPNFSTQKNALKRAMVRA
jgi:hypothetical protein